MNENYDESLSFVDNEKESIYERIERLMNHRSVRDCAKLWDIPHSTLVSALNRRSDPKLSMLLNISEAEGVSLNWLATGENNQTPVSLSAGVSREQVVDIPKYNVVASAGGGTYVDTNTTVELFPFSYQFLKRNRLTHAELYIIEARGDSMESQINDGDELLVKEIQEMPDKPFDGTFVISLDDQLRVKNLEYSFVKDGYRIISENKLYAEEFVPRRELEQRLRVLGEVAIVMGKPRG